MPRKSAKTDITVDRFRPVHFITELAEEAKKKSEASGEKKYKSINIRLDALHSVRLMIVLQKALEKIDELEDKVSLTIYVDEDSTNQSLRMTVTGSDR